MLTMENDIAPDDVALLARLRAMPEPGAFRAMRAYKTHEQRMNAFYRELDKANNATPADDVALMARLNALPAPKWLAPMLAYRTHAQRMAAWYKELDKHSRPYVWRAITGADIARLERCVTGKDVVGMPRDKCYKPEWSDKRRRAVMAIAAGRGDTFAPGMQGLELSK